MKDKLAKLVCPFFMAMNYYLYILQSIKKETYYIGYSDDPERRLMHHNNESKGFTQRNRPWTLVYTEGFETQSKAMEAERKVKSWKSKKMIRLLITGKIDVKKYV